MPRPSGRAEAPPSSSNTSSPSSSSSLRPPSATSAAALGQQPPPPPPASSSPRPPSPSPPLVSPTSIPRSSPTIAHSRTPSIRSSRPPSPALDERPLAVSSSIHLCVPNRSPSPAASSSTLSQPADAANLAPLSPTDVFEMESLEAGHRRRRSSLMSSHSGPAPGTAGASAAAGGGGGGAGGAGGDHGAGPGAHGPSSSSSSLLAFHRDEPRILEEAAADTDETGRLLRGKMPSPASDDSAEDDDASFSSDDDLRDDEETGLSRKERHRRRRRRERSQRIDQRIAPGGAISAEEKKEADTNVVRSSAVNLFFILSWYFFSLMISIYNKWMFGEGRLNFAFPLFTTCFHMLVQFTLASLVLYFVPSLRPQRRSDRGRSRHQPEVAEKPLMSWFFYFSRIGPCGAATGLDIGLGNMSLKFITLTFYTMCKSSALAFVLIFAFVFRLETPTWRLVAIIATMTVGVVMMVAGEVEFRLGGFLLVISAAFFSGFRWGLTQILLLRNPATSNPFSSIFFLAPVMFVTLLAIALPVEGPVALYHGFMRLGADRGFVEAPLILLFPGCIAFLMTVSEFALLQRTSVVTLSIAGICKEVVTIIAASLVFGDSLTPINFVGLITTIGAISAYNWIKITKMREDAQDDVHRMHSAVDGAPERSVSPRSGSASPLVSEDERAAAGAGTFRRGAAASDGSDEPLVSASGDLVPTLVPIGAGSEERLRRDD